MEVQFADYIGRASISSSPVARSCYLTVGKWPVSSITVPSVPSAAAVRTTAAAWRACYYCNIKGHQDRLPQHRRPEEACWKAA